MLFSAMVFSGWGCGDDLRPVEDLDADAGGVDAAAPDAMPPEPTIFADCLQGELCVVFPPPVSVTDSASITVRGTADTQTGAVRVDGVAATTSDGFATWRATVPLSPGVNTLLVERDDTQGAPVPRLVSFTVISRSVKVFEPDELIMEPTGDEILAMDASEKAIALVDPATGVKRLVSDQLPPRSRGLALDPGRHMALFTAHDRPALYSVALSTGAIAVLSDANNGTGPALIDPLHVAVDTAGDRALVWDRGIGALVAVDLATGDRTIVADAIVGMGPVLADPRSMDLDGATGRLLLADSGLDALVWVDLATGDRTVAALLDPGDGLLDPPRVFEPLSIALMPGQDRVVVPGRTLVEIWWVYYVLVYDLATGTRSVLVSGSYRVPAAGGGMTLRHPWSVAFDAARDRLLIADAWHGSIVAIDPTSAQRTVPWAGAGGPLLVDPKDAVWDAAGNRLLVSDIGWNGLVDVRRDHGEQAVLTDPDRDPRFMFSGHMAWDPAQDLVYAADALDGVDLSAGDMVVHDLDTGISAPVMSTNIRRITDMVMLDGIPDQMVTIDNLLDGCDSSRIRIRDMANHTSTVVSDTWDCGFEGSGSVVGSGPVFGRPVSLALDLAQTRVLVVDRWRGLLGVDLVTGDRTVLSNTGTGTGPAWMSPYPVALDAVNDRALVVDNGLQALLSVDLLTGDRTVVSDANTGLGPNISGSALTLDQNDALAFIVDDTRHALLAVDLESGERVVWWGTSLAIGASYTQRQAQLHPHTTR